MKQALLRLNDLFKPTAVVKTIILTGAAETIQVPSGKNWLILSGHIHHVTATPSSLIIQNFVGAWGFSILTKLIPAATATGEHNLFSTTEAVSSATEQHPAFALYLLSEDGNIAFSGDATAQIRIEILEW